MNKYSVALLRLKALTFSLFRVTILLLLQEYGVVIEFGERCDSSGEKWWRGAGKSNVSEGESGRGRERPVLERKMRVAVKERGIVDERNADREGEDERKSQASRESKAPKGVQK